MSTTMGNIGLVTQMGPVVRPAADLITTPKPTEVLRNERLLVVPANTRQRTDYYLVTITRKLFWNLLLLRIYIQNGADVKKVRYTVTIYTIDKK